MLNKTDDFIQMLNSFSKTDDFIKNDKFNNKNTWFYKKMTNLLIKKGKV